MNTQSNANDAARAELLAGHYSDADAAFGAIEAKGANKADYKAIFFGKDENGQDEYQLIWIGKADPAPKAKPQGKAKGKAKDAAPQGEAPKAKQGKRGAAARIAAQGDLKAKPKGKAKDAPAKDYGNSWRPLSARKWIGPWADYKAKAEKGQGPDAGSAKLDIAKLDAGKPWNEAMLAPFNGAFSANTHWPFRKRIAALAALIRARDPKGLRALEIKEISTTPNMLAKLRDLAIAALSAKEEKANGKKAKAEAPAPAAPQG